VLIAFNKPYGVLSQFTPEPNSRWDTLARFRLPGNVHPVGRLDADSEGLLLLTDEPGLNSRLLSPAQGHSREYWVQVERVPSDATLKKLASGGIRVGDHLTRPCAVRILDAAEMNLPPRMPPIRFRRNVADAWIALTLTEGKNRQVRRMTAAVGHPTLRLFRARIGELDIQVLGLAPGRWRKLGDEESARIWRR